METIPPDEAQLIFLYRCDHRLYKLRLHNTKCITLIRKLPEPSPTTEDLSIKQLKMVLLKLLLAVTLVLPCLSQRPPICSGLSCAPHSTLRTAYCDVFCEPTKQPCLQKMTTTLCFCDTGFVRDPDSGQCISKEQCPY
ncbi:uncharacterized protein ACNLHF_002312 isoform 2-T2 [Anomaloglossus baeobatrachus]